MRIDMDGSEWLSIAFDLRVAADQYERDAITVTLEKSDTNGRLSAQFRQQAKRSRLRADQIESEVL